ncbi:MATE family efflux transporter [Primorskyibacter sp. S187A]|uniref:MATE family efflux transporter n=1 Tax=Primorskyibacter sp. S187A TaxID=3415130 RepID=UPI003C7EAE54
MADALTHGRVLRIALPILLANVTIPILGAVDTAVVGQIPQAEPIAAVGVGAIVLSAVYWIFGFLRMGTTGLTAQAAGAKRSGEVAALLTRSLMIGLAGGVALILLHPLIFWGAFHLSPASHEVEELAREYMAIRIWSAPAAVATFGLSGWLIGQERSGAVMAQQLCINGVNVALSLIFVLGMGFGVAGVAWATFIADWLGLGFGLWLCRAAFSQPSWRDWPRIFDGPALRNMAVINTDILLRSLMLQVIFVSFLLIGGQFGDATLAANQVLLQFLYFTGYAMDGFAFAAESLVGKAFGARRAQDLRRSVVLTTIWSTATALVMSLAFWLLGPWMIRVMSKAPDVQDAALTYLPWMIAAPPMQVGLVMMDGIFIGATRSGDMRNMMALSAVIYGIALWLLLPWGNHGLWLALHVSFLARGLTLLARYPALERAIKLPTTA